MRFSDELQSMTANFFDLYGGYSPTVMESLAEGDGFALTYFRNSRVPATWQGMHSILERGQDAGRDVQEQFDQLFDLSERETIREAIISQIELEIREAPTVFH